MFLHGHYQNAYVTRDLDQAMALLAQRFGLSDYIVFEPDMLLQTPAGEKPARLRAALAWSGALQIELIEPGTGFQEHYLAFLPDDPADPTPHFHHAAVRRDDLAAMRAEITQLGLPVAFEGSVPGMVFIYLDARAALGHYLEYVWATREAWDMIGWPPARPVY